MLRLSIASLLVLFGCAHAATEVPTASVATEPRARPVDAASSQPAPAEAALYASRFALGCAPLEAGRRGHCEYWDAVELAGGDVVLGGEVWGSVRIGDEVVRGRSMPNMLLLRVAADGEVRWIRTYGRSWHNSVRHVALHADGTIFVAGTAGNHLHPSLSVGRDRDGWKNERGVIGVIDDEGRWVRIRDYDGSIADLRASETGVRVVGTYGLARELDRELTVVDEVDHAFEEPRLGPNGTLAIGSELTYVVRLDPEGGVYRVRWTRHAGGYAVSVVHYERGRATESETLLDARDAGGFFAVVDHAGRLVVAADAVEVGAPDGTRVARWWLVDREGTVLWQTEERFPSTISGTEGATLLSLAARDDAVYTALRHGTHLTIGGVDTEATEPNASGAASTTVLLRHGLADGHLDRVITPEQSCFGARLSVGRSSERPLFAWTSAGLVATGDRGTCDGGSVAVALLAERD